MENTKANLIKINGLAGRIMVSNRFEFVNCQLFNGKYLTTFEPLISNTKQNGNDPSK